METKIKNTAEFERVETLKTVDKLFNKHDLLTICRNLRVLNDEKRGAEEMKKKIKKEIKRRISRLCSFFAILPFAFQKPKITEPKYVSHSNWINHLEKEFNKEGMRVLEVGSRNVTGANFRKNFSKATYVGFDFYDGENVDIVGDAHKLTSYFKDDEKFDLIFSSAVFEHLYMPWIAAQEIQKLLKVGGHVFIETHFSFASHARPWNFFQFSDTGLRALFNNALGFDLIDSGMSNPMCGYFSFTADKYLRYRLIGELYCHSEILCRKRCEVDDFQWRSLEIDDVVDGTRYPCPKTPGEGEGCGQGSRRQGRPDLDLCPGRPSVGRGRSAGGGLFLLG